MKKYTYLVNFDSQTLERVGESFAVKGDGGIAELEFAIPSSFGVPANQALWRVFYKLPGEKDSLFETLPTVTATESGDYATSWTISKAITQKAGRLAFSLAAISGENVQWNSRTVIMQVPESQYQPESEEAEEPYTGRLVILEGDMAQIRGEFAEVQDDFEELKETVTLGTPVPKSLASEMVEGGVYLYTGTETGYTAGHVYYYVNGTLTDGGVYGGTAIDATLTQSGQAADAKVTGDKIAAIKEDLSHTKRSVYQSGIDLTGLFGTFEGRLHNGITFEVTSNGFKASGTATASAFTDIFYNKTELMQGILPKSYLDVKVASSSNNLRCVFGFFNLEGAVISPIRYLTSDSIVFVPEEAIGMYIRIDVIAGTTVTNDTIEIHTFIAKETIPFGAKDYSVSSTTTNGITFEWDSESTRYHVYGTATGNAFYNFWHSFYNMPAGILRGNKLLLVFNPANKHIESRIIFYAANNDVITSTPFVSNGTITVPNNAVGMTIRITVYRPWSVDDYIYPPRLYKYENRASIVPVPMGRPKYISFIDDDTTTDVYVERYFNACMHNGVKGNYAVITNRYLDGTNDIEKLKDYEASGFNLCLHCDTQQRYLNPTIDAYNPVLARKNYIRAINGFRTLGLVNTKNTWIIPYGYINEENMKIAKDLGFDVAFSTYGSVYNTVYDNNVYTLRRTVLATSGAVTDDTDTSEPNTMAMCKARVNELANDPDGGWLVITTHFNEWDSETWDSSVDENGYQIGYARFNELVQYALSMGLVPVSIGEGVSYIKPILEQNSTKG